MGSPAAKVVPCVQFAGSDISHPRHSQEDLMPCFNDVDRRILIRKFKRIGRNGPFVFHGLVFDSLRFDRLPAPRRSNVCADAVTYDQFLETLRPYLPPDVDMDDFNTYVCIGVCMYACIGAECNHCHFVL